MNDRHWCGRCLSGPNQPQTTTSLKNVWPTNKYLPSANISLWYILRFMFSVISQMLNDLGDAFIEYSCALCLGWMLMWWFLETIQLSDQSNFSFSMSQVVCKQLRLKYITGKRVRNSLTKFYNNLYKRYPSVQFAQYFIHLQLTTLGWRFSIW